MAKEPWDRQEKTTFPGLLSEDRDIQELNPMPLKGIVEWVLGCVLFYEDHPSFLLKNFI